MVKTADDAIQAAAKAAVQEKPQSNLSRKIARCDNCHGENLHQVSVSIDKEFEISLCGIDISAIFHHIFQSSFYRLSFQVLASVKGNTFGIISQTHQSITQIGFPLKLKEVEPNQRLSQKGCDDWR